MSHTDVLKGGLADQYEPEDFNKEQLRKGIKVELEHTDDRQMAKEIAMDHLKEDPKYYDKLEKIESGKHEKNASFFWSGFEKRAEELTAASRKKISKSNFAIPEKRKYPIHDRSHARNALARVSQHGTTEEKRRVRKAVEQKYPELREED